MEFNKKAISPVVATALLLVVAVVAVVGFQTWFNTYQSGLTSKVEKQSAAGPAITVEMLQYNDSSSAFIYLKNIDTNNITITSLRVGTCLNPTPGDAVKSTVTKLNVTVGCGTLNQGNSYDVVVMTNDGIYSETEILR